MTSNDKHVVCLGMVASMVFIGSLREAKVGDGV